MCLRVRQVVGVEVRVLSACLPGWMVGLVGLDTGTNSDLELETVRSAGIGCGVGWLGTSKSSMLKDKLVDSWDTKKSSDMLVICEHE